MSAKLSLAAKIILCFVLLLFVSIGSTNKQTQAATCDTGCSCGSISGCPTGDAAIGVNFTGLTTADLQNGTFRVTATGESSQYTCNYSGGTAGSSGSCVASFNSAANNIECGIEHLDCRNKPFDITLSYPDRYSCTPSTDSVNAQNCVNNTPITVNCIAPQPIIRNTPPPLATTPPPAAATPPPCISQSASSVACGTSNTTCTNGPNCTGTCNVIGNYCSTGTCCGTTCCPSTGTCTNGVCTTAQSASFTCTGIWASQPTNPCTSSPCNINLGANYGGTRSSPIQQCWSKDGVQWGCNTDNMSTSNTFACGTSSTVTMTALDSNNRQAVCPAVSITPTCSLSNTPPPPPPPPQAGCFVCDTGSYRTTSSSNCVTNGNQQCNANNSNQGACLGAAVGQACGAAPQTNNPVVTLIANFVNPNGTPYNGEGLPYYGYPVPIKTAMASLTNNILDNYNGCAWTTRDGGRSLTGAITQSANDSAQYIMNGYSSLTFVLKSAAFSGWSESDILNVVRNRLLMRLVPQFPAEYGFILQSDRGSQRTNGNVVRNAGSFKSSVCPNDTQLQLLLNHTDTADNPPANDRFCVSVNNNLQGNNTEAGDFCTGPSNSGDYRTISFTVTPGTPASFNMTGAAAACNNTDHTPYTTVTWGTSTRAAATATEAPYDIYRAELTGATAPADSSYVKVGSSTTTTFVDQTDSSHTVKRNTTYYYKVWARNIYGGRFSNDVKYTTTGWCDPTLPELSFSLNNTCYDSSGRIGVGWNRLQPFLIPAADTITPITDVSLVLTRTDVEPNTSTAYLASIRCRQFDGNIGACRNGCGWYACSNQCWPSGTALSIGCTGVGTPAVNYQVSGVPIPTAGSYTLSAKAHDSADNLAQTLPQPFTIRTTCDATLPIVNAPNLNNACYDRSGRIGIGWSLQDIQVFASDDVGVVSLNFIITNTDTGAVNTYPASLSSGTNAAGYWSPTPSIPFPGPGQFSIKAIASDAAGNTQTSGSVNFTAADPCLNAWIQTSGGDVGSNTKIRMPTDQ